MKFLFIHQNFPAQFRYLAPELARRGHEVLALLPVGKRVVDLPGVKQSYYAWPKPIGKASHHMLDRLHAQTVRANGCFERALELKQQGYEPDVIVAHTGWGEAMFLGDVWPKARKVVYCEYFYRSEGQDLDFDLEFEVATPHEKAKLRLANTATMVSLEQAAAAVAPTKWQASLFPEWAQKKISVIHEGIDTDEFAPDKTAQIEFDVEGRKVTYRAGMPLVTYVTRSLEPYRGAHTFLRSLVPLLRANSQVQVAVVGGDDVSYGRPRSDGRSWKDHFISEIRPQLTDQQWQRIAFLGRVPVTSYRRLLQCSMVHVYLTYPFVLSWSLLEAMSTGCAIVASRTAPVEEVISDGQNGRLVDFFSPEDVSINVLALLDDADRRAKFGSQARQVIQDRFDLKKTCLPQLVDLVCSVQR
jgi:glycosyltransferase involved in cell wall biosynthesis